MTYRVEFHRAIPQRRPSVHYASGSSVQAAWLKVQRAYKGERLELVKTTVVPKE